MTTTATQSTELSFEVVDPDDFDRPVAYGETVRVLLTTLTQEFFMPRFAERDAGERDAPIELMLQVPRLRRARIGPLR